MKDIKRGSSMRNVNIYQQEIWENICDSFYKEHGYFEKPNYKGMRKRLFINFLCELFLKIYRILGFFVVFFATGKQFNYIIAIIVAIMFPLVGLMGPLGPILYFGIVGWAIHLLFGINIFLAILLPYIIYLTLFIWGNIDTIMLGTTDSFSDWVSMCAADIEKMSDEEIKETFYQQEQ